ncbi:hypothetical protein JXD20_03735 [Candidatus Peregrinibacteria bacterium]|nr:hypothetical protein [Candidatus Peregrinibacteria bacterium]
MIRKIDEMLLEKGFASRSDFFRHLVRMWFTDTINNPPAKNENPPPEEIDLEYGIPLEVIEKIKEKAKLLI